MSPSAPRRSRIRTIAVVGTCAAAVASAGVITTFASAATPARMAGMEGCTGSYTAVTGSGTFTLPDVAGDSSGVPGSGPGVIEPALIVDDEEAVTISGVVDMHNVSVTCTAVNNLNTYNASYIIRIGVGDVDGTTCLHGGLTRYSTEVGHADAPKQFTGGDSLQCDNPVVVRVTRQISTEPV